MSGTTSTTVLTRRVANAYGWGLKVARTVVNNYADQLTNNDLFDDSGYLTDDGMAAVTALIVADNGQPSNPDALQLPAPVKVASKARQATRTTTVKAPTTKASAKANTRKATNTKVPVTAKRSTRKVA